LSQWVEIARNPMLTSRLTPHKKGTANYKEPHKRKSRPTLRTYSTGSPGILGKNKKSDDAGLSVGGANIWGFRLERGEDGDPDIILNLEGLSGLDDRYGDHFFWGTIRDQGPKNTFKVGGGGVLARNSPCKKTLRSSNGLFWMPWEDHQKPYSIKILQKVSKKTTPHHPPTLSRHRLFTKGVRCGSGEGVIYEGRWDALCRGWTRGRGMSI